MSVYDDLKAIDPGVAEAYKRETGDNPNVKVGVAAARRIFSVVLKDKTINDAESEALVQLIGRGILSDDAVRDLIKQIQANFGAFPTKQLKGTELADVRHALGVVVAKLNFLSPYTRLTYSKAQYHFIMRLIDAGEILVMKTAGGFLRQLAGDQLQAQYYSGILAYQAGLRMNELYANIVHECSHAIQEFSETHPANVFREADAWLITGVVLQQMGVKAEAVAAPGTTLRTVFAKTSPLLSSGKQLAGQPVKDALDEIITSLRADPRYAAELAKPPGTGDRKNLKNQWDLLEALEKAPIIDALASAIR